MNMRKEKKRTMNNPSKILVVNDVENNMALLEKKLQDTGAEIVKAENDIEAMAACLRHEFAVAILDARMLEINDYALLKRLNSDHRTRGISKIFISDSPEKESEKLKGYKVKLSDFLKRPVDAKHLSAKARGFIKHQEKSRILEHAAREWKTAFDTITDMIALLDDGRRVVRCNQAMRDFLNQPYEDILGQTCAALFHKDGKIPAECPFARMEQTRRKESVALPVDDLYLEDEVHPIVDSDGEVTGAVHVLRDITAKVSMEKAMTN